MVEINFPEPDASVETWGLFARDVAGWICNEDHDRLPQVIDFLEADHLPQIPEGILTVLYSMVDAANACISKDRRIYSYIDWFHGVGAECRIMFAYMAEHDSTSVDVVDKIWGLTTSHRPSYFLDILAEKGLLERHVFEEEHLSPLYTLTGDARCLLLEVVNMRDVRIGGSQFVGRKTLVTHHGRRW